MPDNGEQDAVAALQELVHAVIIGSHPAYCSSLLTLSSLLHGCQTGPSVLNTELRESSELREIRF